MKTNSSGKAIKAWIRASPVSVLRSGVRTYQLFLRPVLGPNCRFTPSCSDYALEALARHGALRGSGLAAGRVLRCNPWCEGGHDPVPRLAADQPLPNFKSQAAH